MKVVRRSVVVFEVSLKSSRSQVLLTWAEMIIPAHLLRNRMLTIGILIQFPWVASFSGQNQRSEKRPEAATATTEATPTTDWSNNGEGNLDCDV